MWFGFLGMSYSELSEPDEYISGLEGDDIIFVSNNNTGLLERNYIYGNEGNDVIVGGTSIDHIWGNSGDDTIYGGDYRSTIEGGSGDDVIYAGLGDDSLYGGAGKDTFVMSFNPSSLFSDIDIHDFQVGLAADADVLDLSDALNYNQGDDITDFITFTDGGIGYTYGTITLKIDVDGNASVGTDILIKLIGTTGVDLNTMINDGNIVLF